MYSMLKSTFIISTYFSNDLLPYSCLYLAIFSSNILGEHPLLISRHSPWLLQLWISSLGLWTPTLSGTSLDWISGAFHMHWDSFFDMGFPHLCFSSLSSIIKKAIFAPLMQDGWKIRREQTSTKGSGWIHQDTSPSILSFLHFCHEEHSYFSKKSL